MRDLLMMFVLVLLLYFSWRSAYSAWLLWGWSSLIGLQTFMYGAMASVSYTQWFALLTLILLVARPDPQLAPAGTRMSGVSWLLVILGIHGLLAALLGYPDLPRKWEIATNLLKIILFCLLMPVVVTSRFRMQTLVLVIVLALSIHGLLDGLRFIITGGAHLAGQRSRLGDRNDFALQLVMILPLLAYLVGQFKLKLARLAAGGLMGLTVLTVVSTQSRGGLISLGAVGIWMILRSNRRMLTLSLVSAGAALVVFMAPPQWFARMETIGSAEQDNSFMSRVEAWKRASAIALDNPVFGGGFRAVQAPSVFEKYRYSQGLLGFVETPPAYFARAAHSIYFEVMSDIGFVGLAWFLAIMFSVFFVGRRVRKRAKAIGPSALWAAELSTLVGVSMVAYLVGAALLSLSYVDLPYALVMIVVTLDRILAEEQKTLRANQLLAAATAKAPVRLGAASPRGA